MDGLRKKRDLTLHVYNNIIIYSFLSLNIIIINSQQGGGECKTVVILKELVGIQAMDHGTILTPDHQALHREPAGRSSESISLFC